MNSIYSNVEYEDTPYYKTDKFSVHVPIKGNSNLNSHAASRQNHRQEDMHDTAHPKSTLPQISQTHNQAELNQSGLHQEAGASAKQTRFNLSVDQGSRYKTPERVTQTAWSRNSSAYKSAQQKARMTKTFRESLYYDERTRAVPKSTINNSVIEEIVREQEIITRNKEFVENIYKLKDLGLLKNYQENLQIFKGPGKRQYIFNDYHSKSTNNGYSRNFGGLFFNR